QLVEAVWQVLEWRTARAKAARLPGRRRVGYAEVARLTPAPARRVSPVPPAAPVLLAVLAPPGARPRDAGRDSHVAVETRCIPRRLKDCVLLVADGPSSLPPAHT